MRTCWLRACADIPGLCFHCFYCALKIFVLCESAIFLKEGGVIFLTARRQKFQGTKKTQASPSFTLLFAQNAMPGTNWKCPWTLPLGKKLGFLNCPVLLGSKAGTAPLLRWTWEGEKSPPAHVSRHNWTAPTLGRTREGDGSVSFIISPKVEILSP